MADRICPDCGGPKDVRAAQCRTCRAQIGEVREQYGRWTVLAVLGRRQGHTIVHVRCECGLEADRRLSHLRAGAARSCRKCGNARATHRLTRTPEHVAWSSMLQRCENPKNPNYPNYGGRGISVCERWRASFEAFLTDVGPRPSPKHSIDRHPNNDGNYEPGNVRWATISEQAWNKRSSGPKPKADAVQAAVIVQLSDEGQSERRIAMAVGLTRMAVRTVLLKRRRAT